MQTGRKNCVIFISVFLFGFFLHCFWKRQMDFINLCGKILVSCKSDSRQLRWWPNVCSKVILSKWLLRDYNLLSCVKCNRLKWVLFEGCPLEWMLFWNIIRLHCYNLYVTKRYCVKESIWHVIKCRHEINITAYAINKTHALSGKHQTLLVEDFK